MNTIDTVNRPGTGPISPVPDAADPFGAVRHEHRITNKPPVIREEDLELKSLPTPSVVPPTTSVAADFELASKMYVAALSNHEKAQARILRAEKELASAVEDEVAAAQRRDTLQRELLHYLAPAKK